jgi:hypothetical protein
MANKVLTFIIDTLEPELDAIFAAAIDEIHKAGHSIREIRLTTDAGEEKVPVNTVAGVTVPVPVTADNPTGALPTPPPEVTPTF